ncbi:5-amino-6-(5-phosphoribosylamino)uracil reductase [Teratosphaeria destructans]|uniref:5-amino-6-(5-phosphoribosylamino)uracil reductase n=1 Tax=Teratosphaeria destructans TaxID=418781 RepID=A0A9W7STN7_9PEZI|nr:5-amino-6-(5-phosphoribosylamino)uracil reductase [Teratosphaeria destructans]
MASDLSFYVNANGSTFRPLDTQACDPSNHGAHWGQLAQAPNTYGQQPWPSQSSQQSSGYQYSTAHGYGSNAGYATAPTSQSNVTQDYVQTSTQPSDYRHGSYNTYQSNGAQLPSALRPQDGARNVNPAASKGTTGSHVSQGSRGNQIYQRRSSNSAPDQDHQGNRTAAPPAKHADTEENHHIGFSACKCLPEWLYIRRTDRTWDRNHNHDLEQLDKYKHSDGIMYFAQNKVEEGYSFSAVTNWLHQKYGEVTSQAQFITKQDVANVAQKWRQHNRNIVLKTVVEEPTAEENEQKRCQDLINSTTPEGLMKALAAYPRHFQSRSRS